MNIEVQPWQKRCQEVIELCKQGEDFQIQGRIYTAKLPIRIAQRQRRLLMQSGLNIQDIEHIEVTDSDGPGNAVCLRLCGSNRTTVFTSFGMRGKRSEEVISEVVNPVKHFVDSGAVVDRFLADQLLVYMGIANGGCYTTDVISGHSETNMEVIKKFLPVDFSVEQQGSYFQVRCRAIQ